MKKKRKDAPPVEKIEGVPASGPRLDFKELVAAKGSRQLHPESPSALYRKLVEEGRLSSLEERKANPLWQRPERP